MKIAWVLALGTWAAWCSDATAEQQLRFVTGESLDEILEDEIHRLETVELETFDGVPFSNVAETWSKTYYQLLISCSHGTLQLDREVEKQLVDTTFGCTGDLQSIRSIGVVTTAQEAQQILSSIIYQPDEDYHRSWTGVTDPLCSTGNDGHEIVRMQLIPVRGDVRQPSAGACLAVEPDDFRYSEAANLHEKKISVASVNDPPTVERESEVPLSVNSGGSCVALTGFKLDDTEASAAQVDLVPILILQLSVNTGVLRLHRRSALQSGIYAMGSDESSEEVPLAWKLPDLLDSSLTLKGAISDLNEFLPKVEYCSSIDRSALVPDTLRVTLSDNGFCGGVAKESLSASVTVPITLLPAVDLGEVLFTKANITMSKHSIRIPVQYTFETTAEVECTVELKYDDGMLLGIDYQPSILHKTPRPVVNASRSPPKMLVPMRGLIVRFGSEESSGDSTSFKLARNLCAVNEVCRQVESAALSEESLDGEIIAAAQTLAFDNEGVTELQVIRYPVSRFWLLWNIPVAFVHEVTVVKVSGVSIQAVERRFRLQGNNHALAAQLKTLNIYSLVGGMQSRNRLNVTLSAVDGGASVIPNEQSAQLEIFASPAMENVEQQYPADVVFGEFNEMSLGSVLLAYPPTYITNTALAWTVRSVHGLIWWDPNSVSPAVVSRQTSKNELELRGNLVDLNAALSRVRIDESNVQDVQSSFATMYEDQTYELTAIALSETISVQTLTTSSADGSVVGDIVLAVDLPARFYAGLDLEIASGHCQSAAIGVNDDVSTISSKVTRMACDAVPAKPLEEVFRREVQSIRVFALFPARVAELAGTFRVWFHGQPTDPIAIDATISTLKTSLLKVVVDANGIEVSRNDLPGDNSFEWQITFGTERDVDETFQTDYDETVIPFRLSTTVIQHGRCATDLRLDTFYPGISLSVQRLRPASSGTLAVEFSFESAFNDLPTMFMQTSTLASAQTGQSLDARIKESKTTVISGEHDFFQLMVGNRATTALASCTSASAIEQAIRDLSIDMLRVSVESKTSPFLSGRIDYTIVISAPSVVALELASTATARSSTALFQISFVNEGSEAQVAIDTISMFLETLDDAASLLTSGAVRAWVPRRKRKLGIRLPVSYLQVDSNQTVTIGGIGIEGYSHNLRFTVSCTKGEITLQPKQLSHLSLSSSVNPSSTLEISGFLSTLEVILESNYLLYSPKPGVSGYDKLVFRIDSEDDQASETVPVVIKAPISPPSLTLPPSPIVVVERDIVSITEVVVSVNESREQDSPSCGVILHISAQNGSVELATDDRAQHTPQIQIQGDVENVNAALKGLRYSSPSHNASTEDQLLISASCMTESGEQSSPITFAVPIVITRRAHAIRVLLKGDIIGDTSLLTTKTNSPVAFEDLLIQVNDGDDYWSHCGEASRTGVAATTEACNISVELAIFASHGLVTNFTSGGEEASVLTVAHFSGWIGQANKFLQRQLYVPDAKFSGPDQVVINIKHEMVASEEKAATIEEAILLPVLVSPECEAPRLFWVDSETSKMSFSNPSRDLFALPGIVLTREGLEERHCRDDIVFRVSMHANNGFLTLDSGLATVTIVDDHRTFVLEGRIRDLNMALDAVKFQFEIRRDSHIPITASVEIEVEANGGHKDTQASIVSSAFLQLKFVGDTRPPDMLVKNAMLAFEDVDVLIGGAVNLDAFVDLAANSTVSINVHNGVIYAAADGVQMDAKSDQRFSLNDIRHLRSVMSNLRYSPNRNFNGIDEIDFTMENQKNTLYIYVQAQNDLPSMVVNLEEAKDWYTYPRMFLPSFHVDDPDENDVLHAEIRAINGSLLVDHMQTSTFDGVMVELNLSSSSVRFTSSSGRLNTIFKQRLVEFVPKVCMSNSTTQIRCSALVELCIDDGSASACQELTLPEQERFYRIVVSNLVRNLNVSAGSSLNLSEVFEIHQRFDAMNELFLRVRASSGLLHIDTLNCGELRDMVGVEALQYPERVGMTQIIYAPDAACLNRALASIRLQHTDRANNIVVQLELFSDEMQILANGSISVNATSNVIRKRIRAERTSDELWLASPGTYANLTSLLAASVVEDPAAIPPDGDIQLELNVSCSTCHWTYKTFVPRVSYEFAQVPSSYLRFLGLSKSLNEVLTTLMLTIDSSSSAGAETINFELAPSLLRSSQEMESGWHDSTNISIPYTVQAPALIDVETGKIMRSDSAIHESESHPSSELQEIKLALRNESLTQQMKEGEAQPIGDLLAVSGDVEDARWFRIKMHVLHGRLSIPINVCCVDIRETDYELDVVGSAQALKNALAAAEFQSQDPYTGNDELSVTVAHFASPNEAIASISIPIDIIAINHMPTISHRQLSSSGSFSEEEIVVDDIDFETLEVPVTPFRVSLSSVNGTFFLDDKAKQRVSVLEMQEGDSGYSNFTFEASLPDANVLLARVLYATSSTDGSCGEIDVAVDDQGHGIDTWVPKQTVSALVVRDCDKYRPESIEEVAEVEKETGDMLTEVDVFSSITENNDMAVEKIVAPSQSEYLDDAYSFAVPLIHIEGSMEGPLSTQYWEVVTLTFEVGKSWSISKASIIDSSGQSSVRSDDLTLEIDVNIGKIILTALDGIESTSPEGAFTSSITIIGKMDRLNAALSTLRYQCNGLCSHQDTITLQITNSHAPRPGHSHTRTIRVDQLYEYPVPRVALKASLYYSTEDATFQFPNLTLQFPDNNESLRALELTKASQISQLWSIELSYRPTEYAYPRSQSDDRHRLVADFVGASPPRFFCKMGSAFYFAGSDEHHGEELWASDGSTKGTGIVADLLSGPEGSAPADLVVINGKLIFSALGSAGREIWVSSGAAGTTHQVADIRWGPKSSNPLFYTLFQSRWLLFQAETDEFGIELFKTDGTEAGTIIVEDIWRGPRSSSPSHFVEWTASDGRARMYFAATSDSGRELWVSDAFSSFNSERNHKLAGSVGTFMVADLCIGEDSSNPQFLVATDSTGIFFSATDCIHGRELWLTDGSNTGTKMVKDLNTATGQGSNPTNLVVFAGKVYFQAQADSATGRELYVSDGSAAGTVLLADLVPGPMSSAPTSMFVSGPITFADGSTKSQGLSFTVFDREGRQTIWVSDGTKQGTTPLLDEVFLLSHNLSFPAAKAGGPTQQTFEFGNAIYFATHDFSAGRTSAHTKASPAYQIDIKVSFGSISIVSTEAGEQQTRQNAASQLTLNGGAIDLERDLSRLVYLPPLNWNEEQQPGGHIVDWQFVVSFENKSVESFADLVILPRVDAPVISVPESLEDPFHFMSDYLSILRLECLPLVCDEDTPTVLDGFAVRSADFSRRQLLTKDLLVLSVSVSHGILSLGDTLHANCIAGFVGSQSWKHVSFKATADCINRVLSATTYVGDPNFSGADELKVRVEYVQEGEPDAAFDEVVVPIVIVELNDAPYVEIASVYFEAEEDIPLLIQDLRLQDPDARDELLRIALETDYGKIALLRSEGVTLTRETLTNIGEGTSRLTLEGSLRNLNAAMASVVYTSAKDWNSLQYRPDGGMNGFDAITIHATDLTSFNASSTSVLFVYVGPQPDPVVIGIPANAPTSIYANDPPGTIRGDEDTRMSISGLAFSSQDDTSRATLAVSLSVEHGILSLSKLNGITFLEESADLGQTVKVMGTFASVNAAVIDLRYLPNKDFYGMDLFVVTAYAIDEYTQQETPSASIDVAITVNPVNDPPVWSIGSSTVREIHQGQGVSLTGISFTDVDVAVLDCTTHSCEMDLVVEASHGLVTRSDQSSSLFSNDLTTNTAAYVVLSGTPDKLNTMLSEMLFELEDPGYYRADSPHRTDIKLQLTVDDRGTFGSGGPQISTTTVVFSPVVWSHYEVSFLAPEGVLTLDEDTTFVFDGDLQLSDLDSARPSRNLLKLTVSCTNGTFALSGRVDGIQVARNESDSDGVVVIRGYFSQLNAALNGSSYVPAANWYGSEQLSLALVELDSPGKSRRAAVASIFLFVAPVCDEPSWASLTTEPKTMKEDGYLLIDTLSLTSPDLDNEQREVEVTIGVKHGGVMLSMTRGLLIQHSAHSTSEDRLITQHIPPGHAFSSSRLFFKDLVFRGRVSDVNGALKGMIFKPWLDYNSNGWHADEIELGATSSCGGTGSSSFITIPVAVNAVNDPPVLLSQHFQFIPPLYSLHNLEVASRYSSIEAIEDLPQALESTELFDADADPHGDDLRLLVNISCIHCTITSEHLSQSSEFHPSDDLIVVARNWKNEEGVQLVVHGDILSLNKGLMNQLSFRGADNFYGLAFVVINVSDFGNYGEGGEQHSAFVLGVQVKPASDAPQIHLPKYQSQEAALQLDEGASVLIQGAPALSTLAASARQQTPEWSVMSANLLAHDSSTRLHSLHAFSGSEGLEASFVVPHNGGFLFSGHDANFGGELWRSDGTAVGTVLLKDIFPGYEGSRPSYLTPFSKDNQVYFAAKGPHLSWMVKENYQDSCQSSRPSSFDANVFFTVAAHNVWDPEETYDCPLGFRWMSTSEAHNVFVGTIGLEGHSDEPLTYFDQCGWHGYEWGGQPRKYFRFSDSKATGAFKHAGFRDSYRVHTGFQTDLFAGIVCYREVSAYQTTWGSQLWATDGTSKGTQRIARISTDADGSKPAHFVELDNRLYFQASSTEFGAELWSTDGSRVGTYLVADIEFGSRSSEPRFLIAFDSRLFFSARTLGYGREIWFSDGDSRFKFTGDEHATVGTGLLLDICVGEKSSSPQHFAVLSPATGSAVLLFQADDCVHGPELWKTDGTRAGTALVLDINKGSVGSLPAYLTPFAGKVYFQADDGTHGAELWTTDGTSSGTVMLVDIAPGVLGSVPSFFTVLDNVNIPSGILVFAAQAERDRLTEFWRSDGTSSGTAKLFPQSREVVELNIESLNLQLAGHKFVSFASQPEAFFYLGRKRDQGVDFQSETASRFGVAHAEDVARTRSITLQDVETAQKDGDLTLSLSCSKGWLSLGRQCDGVAVTGDGEAPDPKQVAVLTLRGSLDALNCAVEKVTYHSKPHENGWDEIYVTLSQGIVAVPGEVNNAMSAADDPGRDDSYTVSKRMLVDIRAVNDPPSIRMASVYYVPPSEWVGLTEIEVTDPDSGDGILYVNIAIRSGKLRVTLPQNGNGGGPAALHATGDGDSSQTLEFAATVEQAKELFQTLEYMCDDRYGCSSSQRDYMTVQVDDNGFTGSRGPQVTSKTAAVIVVLE